MASRYAKKRAKSKAQQVYRTNIRLPKKAVVKKFANFVGKSTYKQASPKRKAYSKGYSKPLIRNKRVRRKVVNFFRKRVKARVKKFRPFNLFGGKFKPYRKKKFYPFRKF